MTSVAGAHPPGAGQLHLRNGRDKWVYAHKIYNIIYNKKGGAIFGGPSVYSFFFDVM